MDASTIFYLGWLYGLNAAHGHNVTYAEAHEKSLPEMKTITCETCGATFNVPQELPPF